LKNKYQKKSHISELKFRQVLKCLSVGVPALSTAVLAGFNHKTTQHIYSLLRERIVALVLEEARPFVGDIEVDESYFGAKRIRGKRGQPSDIVVADKLSSHKVTGVHEAVTARGAQTIFLRPIFLNLNLI
jgi:hypothetical protein